jgi:hypothetical protein
VNCCRHAPIDNPNIVRVRSVFEANNTAYMRLDFIKGKHARSLAPERREADRRRVQPTIAAIRGLAERRPRVYCNS